MPNWFQNAISSVQQVSNTASGGVGSALANVFGGIVGGVTAGVTGSSGIAGGTLAGGGAPDAINTVLNNPNLQGTVGTVVNSSSVSNLGGGLGSALGGGAGSLLGGNNQTKKDSGFFGSVRVNPETGLPSDDPNAVYAGFWSYWKRPTNYRFYIIWIGGILFLVLVAWGIMKMMKPKPRLKKKKPSGGGRL